MFGLTIADVDERGILTIDLRDILAALGQDAIGSRWRLEGVEAIGAAAEALHILSDRHASVTGLELVRLANDVDQIVDGTFTAVIGETETPWVIIRAVDSSAYDVMSPRPDVILQMQRCFRSATFIPGMEPPGQWR